jgi:hypothetical protein
MKNRLSLFRLDSICTVFALLISLPSASRAVEAPIAERPVFQPGDSFEYVDRFQTVACRRWEVKEQDHDGALVTQCDDNLAYFSAKSGALLRITRKDGTDLVSFRPFAPAIPFPLRVGSTWGGKFSVSTSGDLITPSLSEKCEVVAYETVKVAAGDLAAFRFNCDTRWSVWPLHGSITVPSWYAPSAKTVVKSVNGSDAKWNMELAGFQVQ